ncbi:MAG: FecR family protein [Syntrophales bacterium]|nr:FecR family protein [Syntrophales bacterium]
MTFRNIVFLFCTAFFLFIVSSQDVCARRLMVVKIGKEEAKVILLEGTASVIPGDGNERYSLKVGDILKGGDRVNTGPKSRLEIVLKNNTVLRFADNTCFEISQIGWNGKSRAENVKVRLLLGRTWANVSKTLGVKTNFELSCENAVAGVRGTVYRMNVKEDKSVLVRVYDGMVYVAGGGKIIKPPKRIEAPEKIPGPVVVPGPEKVTLEEWTYLLKSMQQVSIKGDGAAERPRDFTLEEDKNEWVDWNRSRDDL